MLDHFGMASDDTPIALLPVFEHTKAALGLYRGRSVNALMNSTGRWIIVRRDGDEILSDANQWEPAGAMLSRNLVPLKAMCFSGPDAALEHLRASTQNT